jgi:uncharacterized protein (TIGR02453 family)
MAFRGWPAEALEFYEGLEADNSKTYWTANRTVYDEQVLAPMTELLAELSPEFGDAKIFRPYRDVRFSADKSPYKTAIGATIGSGYVQLSADGLGAGSGMWMMAPDQLDRYRRAVANDRTGVELVKVIAAIEKASIEVGGHGSLKTAPKGYASDHPRIELLRHKGLVAWQGWPVAAWLGTAAAKKRVVDFLRTTRPLVGWLDTNVGSSTSADSRH